MKKKAKRPSQMEIDEWVEWCQQNTERYLESIYGPKDPPRSVKRLKYSKPKKNGETG